jgi:hypothetical protein
MTEGFWKRDKRRAANRVTNQHFCSYELSWDRGQGDRMSGRSLLGSGVATQLYCGRITAHRSSDSFGYESGTVLKLNKSLYGIKQAPRVFYDLVKEHSWSLLDAIK